MTSEPPTLTRRGFLSAAAAGIVSSSIWAKTNTARVSDSRLLSDIEHRTFNFYWEHVNHSNGLMADRWSTPSVCSITGTGFALTAWPIGVERGWITRNQLAAIQRYSRSPGRSRNSASLAAAASKNAKSKKFSALASFR